MLGMLGGCLDESFDSRGLLGRIQHQSNDPAAAKGYVLQAQGVSMILMRISLLLTSLIAFR
jgi:hypothetical protein